MYTGNYNVREDATLVFAATLKFLQDHNHDVKSWLKRIAEGEYGFAEIDELTDFNMLAVEALHISDAEIFDENFEARLASHIDAVMNDVCVLCAQELTK